MLERCGDDLTRENVMKQATSLKDVPGGRYTLQVTAINTSPTDHRGREPLKMMKFNRERSHHYWTTSRVNMPQLTAGVHFLCGRLPGLLSGGARTVTDIRFAFETLQTRP